MRAGTRLGPYEIMSPLGAGGMGEVYRARDARLGRLVAIKALPDRLASQPQALARFTRETRLLAALSHPNILSIFDVGSDHGVAFAVMELLDGETLRRALSKGRIAAARAIDFTQQVSAGLAAAHANGIVHRDLKPENIFIAADGRVKLLDFGLAMPLAVEAQAGGQSEIATRAEDAAFRTMPGTVLGTIGYMSPEQVRGEEVDHRSDIFSLGVVLHEMVTGRRPFRGRSPIETLNAILAQDPEDIGSAAPDVPPALDHVAKRCLQKAPADRFQSARDVGFALEIAAPAGSRHDTRRVAADRRHRLGHWWAALVAIVLFTVAGGAWYLGEKRGTSPALAASFQTISFRPQAIFRAFFAPDGRIVYSAALQGNEPEIFILSAQYPEARAIGLADTDLLSVSSKGELAVLIDAHYLMHRSFEGTLARVPLGATAPREIRENVKEADWSPDGQNLAIIERVAGTDRIEYPIGKVLCQTSGWFSDLRFSPSGDRLAFLEHPIYGDDRGSVKTVDLAGHTSVLMSERYASEQGVAWSPDGSTVFFTTGNSPDVYVVYAVSLDKTAHPVLTSAGGVTIQDISPGGRWLATRDDIRLFTIGKAPGTSGERDLSFLDYSEARDISADGRTILLSEATAAIGPTYGLYLRRTDGSPPVRLGDGLATGLSPDGRWALSAVPSLPPRLMVYPTGPGEARVLPRGPIEAYNAARWFPDGKKVLLCAAEPGHALRTYVQLASGGLPRPITADGVCGFLVAPDGRKVVARDPDRRALLIDIESGASRPIPGATPDDVLGAWTADGHGILVWGRSEMPSHIDRIDTRTGARTRVHPIVPPDIVGALGFADVTVTPDASAYTYTYYQQRSTLFLVDGVR